MARNNTCVYVEDLFFEQAINYLNNQSQRNSGDPFFLYLAFTNPHAGGWAGQEETGAPVPRYVLILTQ